MSSEWNTVPLGDVASFKTGKLDSNAAEQGGKYPFFTCSPNTLAINSFAFDAEAVILAGNNANGVFSCKHYSGKFNAYQRTYVIEPLSKSIASCRYLFFVISHQVNHLKELSVGSATKFLTKTILNNLPVALPRLEEQERIAELLGALDDRITLLRETNATLEAIAQALFKSWFVDFDPVRAKQEGRAPEGMSDATAALFPDGFEESELDLVPKGWRYSTVGESFILTMGQSPPGDTYEFKPKYPDAFFVRPCGGLALHAQAHLAVFSHRDWPHQIQHHLFQ
jgi:type I restriction enzyme S subunit